MPINIDKQKINEVLTRGVEEVIDINHLRGRMEKGEKLRVKFGVDPTGPKIHLGRAVPLRKLRAFQDLGHQIVFIVGDFTARIGDPSDKLQKRPMLSKEEVESNLKDYIAQLGKILDMEKVEIHYNSEFLSKLNLEEISELAESFTVGQMLARRNFKDRFERGEEISVREFLYPLMQGYDSLAINADLEIGGNDQLFNLKAGRIVQKHYGKNEQDILITRMLEGTDGRKMSTSWGNVITIVDEPNEIFGKLMSINDELITKYLLLTTDIPEVEIVEIGGRMEKGELNPRDAKMDLAKMVVEIYYGESEAQSAKNNFIETFKKGGAPEDVREVEVDDGVKLNDVLLGEGIVASNTEFRRLIDGNAIEVGDDKITDNQYKINKSCLVRVGKHRFLKIKIKD
ncbi:MAG: tyrosine--tRNA ligase [Parcubacteria group bacterium CG10_big_fil_rev_8_21_14_0_10_38_31]|nr:MAG: tyrosine--tRNA ligase [Parcubacteria group bacterium CG10_big_fil_rev_8_21_14_0_10_38_31]